jgi:hypothetical protein
MTQRCWTIEELHAAMTRFQAELVAANLTEKSVHTYIDRASRYIRWLGGNYVPRPRS